VVKQAPRNVRTALVAPFSPQTEVTFYSRYGDVFAWACVIISLVGGVCALAFRARTMIEARPRKSYGRRIRTPNIPPCAIKCAICGAIFDAPSLRQQLAEIEKKVGDPNVWG